MYFSSLQGHATSAWPGSSGAPTECRAGTKSPVGADQVEGRLAHPRHDPHVQHDVRAVADLDAQLADGRTQGAHRERDDVHRATAHAAGEQARERCAHLRGWRPVVGGTGVALALGTDEGSVLDPRDVARVGAGEEGVGALPGVETRQHPARHGLGAEPVPLLLGAVGPLDAVGLRELGHLADPGEQLRVRRGASARPGTVMAWSPGRRAATYDTECPLCCGQSIPPPAE